MELESRWKSAAAQVTRIHPARQGMAERRLVKQTKRTKSPLSLKQGGTVFVGGRMNSKGLWIPNRLSCDRRQSKTPAGCSSTNCKLKCRLPRKPETPGSESLARYSVRTVFEGFEPALRVTLKGRTSVLVGILLDRGVGSWGFPGSDPSLR